MGLRINTNIPALNANRQTEQSNRLLTNALRQLSSGLRINRAADDAAGLAIAEQFNTQARQGRVEINNLQSGYNVAATAEGGLQVQQEAVQRIRELALQAGNGTLSPDDRAALNAEAQQLIEQIGGIAQDTEFNGQALLNENQTVDLGTAGGNQVNLNASTPEALGLDTIDLSTAEGAAAAIGAADTASQRISTNRSNLGAQMNRFESAISQREIGVENAVAAESMIRDLDVAQGVIQQTQGQILLQGGLAALIQSNVTPQGALSLLGT